MSRVLFLMISGSGSRYVLMSDGGKDRAALHGDIPYPDWLHARSVELHVRLFQLPEKGTIIAISGVVTPTGEGQQSAQTMPGCRSTP